MAIPHNSKCRYGERGAADAKPKAQIILDAAKVSAASGGNSEPKQGQRSQSARGFCPRSTMRVPQPDIIEHFGNADAVPQLPERCLSRKAGIVRCCPKSFHFIINQRNEGTPMVAQIITIAIEKGGAGKTVTASNLAYLMGDEGKKVLCIDTDPQGNLTSALSGGNGITSGVYNGRALFDMFDGFRYTKTKDYITETEYENVDMIPCSAQTPRINQRIPGIFEDAQTYFKPGNPKCLTNMGEFLYYFLNQVREDYDYIIIDTQPTRDSLLLTNAINAADYVLIPSLCEANSQESAFRTYALCNELRNTPGSHLKGVGVILTMVVKKAATTKIIRDQCKQVLGASLYKTEIPSGLSVNMSVTKHLPVCYMAKTQPVAVAYVKAYEELKAQLAKMGVN